KTTSSFLARSAPESIRARDPPQVSHAHTLSALRLASHPRCYDLDRRNVLPGARGRALDARGRKGERSHVPSGDGPPLSTGRLVVFWDPRRYRDVQPLDAR